MSSISLRSRAAILPALFLAVGLASAAYGQTTRDGTLKHPIIDSRMTEREAFDGLDPKCPEEIRRRQRLVAVRYYSTDGKVHQGQLVLDSELAGDVKRVFALALKERFPIHSVIP
ncbi:MAG: hypothetical protein M3348_14480, partial [Acidobacteriota bacterium]|nr:hypothetical protein [Acidobacteriota bacterium]